MPWHDFCCSFFMRKVLEIVIRKDGTAFAMLSSADNGTQKMKIKSIKYNGESFDYSTEKCIDSYEITVSLDLGNGEFDHIGYLPADAPEALVKELILEELEGLSN